MLSIAGGLPTSPLFLAFVLGKTLETNMLRAFQYVTLCEPVRRGGRRRLHGGQFHAGADWRRVSKIR